MNFHLCMPKFKFDKSLERALAKAQNYSNTLWDQNGVLTLSLASVLTRLVLPCHAYLFLASLLTISTLSNTLTMSYILLLSTAANIQIIKSMYKVDNIHIA